MVWTRAPRDAQVSVSQLFCQGRAPLQAYPLASPLSSDLTSKIESGNTQSLLIALPT